MSTKASFGLLGVWTLVSLLLPLLHTGFNADMVTRILVLGFFGVLIFWYRKYGANVVVSRPKMVFILFATVNALIVEVFHMFSRPLVPALRITGDMPLSKMFEHTLVDIVLTLPAYLIIFTVMWFLMTRYHYSAIAFFVVMSLGQALGDGNAFFLANPVMLIFIPYVMLNYWAMNFIPFLVVQRHLPPPAVTSRLKAYLVPLVVLPLTYLIVAAGIFTVGKVLGLLP